MLVFGASGAGFALANILLARGLPKGEYALFTLVLALMNLGAPLAAAGIDVVAVRRPLRYGPGLLGQVLFASSVVSLGVGLVGAAYRLGPAQVAMIVAAGVAGGVSLVAAGEYQRRHRLARSLVIVHAPNLVLLVAAAATLAAGVTVAWPPLLLLTAGFALCAIGGWAPLLREPPGAAGDTALPWREAFSLFGANASGTLLTQLDRLIIPHLLPLSMLATYGALSAVVGSLFRVLQRGIGYALLPRLRSAGSVRERRRLVLKEARMVAVVVLAGSLVLWFATPLVEDWLLGGKYRFAPSLVLATILVGLAKIVTGFSRATVTALADGRELALVNLTGWVSVALAVGAAFIGARWGLAGVIYGVGLGWLMRSLASLAITVRHLRHAPPGTAAASAS